MNGEARKELRRCSSLNAPPDLTLCPAQHPTSYGLSCSLEVPLPSNSPTKTLLLAFRVRLQAHLQLLAEQMADGPRRQYALFFVSSRRLAKAIRTRALALGTTPACHNVFVRHSIPSVITQRRHATFDRLRRWPWGSRSCLRHHRVHQHSPFSGPSPRKARRL
jgi:hypothetical protein